MDRRTGRASWLVVVAGCLLVCAAAAPCQETKSPPWTKGSAVIAVLPDTQYYAQKYPQYFEAQTKWIADNREKINIIYALHLGDITQHDSSPQWEVAKRCFDMLEGKVPYLLVPGNHDYSGGGRKTRMSEHFPVAKMKKWKTFGGVFEEGKLDNNYHLFTIGDQEWIALGLECGPRDEVLTWANKVLEKHAERRCILVTHAYLFRGNVRYDHRMGSQRASPHGFAGNGNDGEEMWQKLVRRHKNMMIVISGHVATGGLGYLPSEGDYGNTVHQMMVCYQKMRGGGQAFMRLLEFLPDGKTVQVRTYSPALKRRLDSELEQFKFVLQPATREKPKKVSGLALSKLSKAPIHRWSFDGSGGHGTKIKDSIGNRDGSLKANRSDSKLNGEGKLVLLKAGCVNLPRKLVSTHKDVSFEVWFTPTAKAYNWNAVVRFGSERDWLTYVFRTLNVHRAEIAVNTHNEDIQRKLTVKPGEQMHVAVTYDHDGANGKPLLGFYRDGRSYGTMPTRLTLGDVKDSDSRIGPFEGTFDELRIYDYALSAAEVHGTFVAGPQKVEVLDVQKK